MVLLLVLSWSARPWTSPTPQKREEASPRREFVNRKHWKHHLVTFGEAKTPKTWNQESEKMAFGSLKSPASYHFHCYYTTVHTKETHPLKSKYNSESHVHHSSKDINLKPLSYLLWESDSCLCIKSHILPPPNLTFSVSPALRPGYVQETLPGNDMGTVPRQPSQPPALFSRWFFPGFTVWRWYITVAWRVYPMNDKNMLPNNRSNESLHC